MLRAVPLLAVFAIAAEPATEPKVSLDFATVPSIAQLRAVKFLPVPADVTVHRFEERGFVAVPLDYARKSESPTLRIFYRLMPVRGSTARGTKAPIVVVINGGPAAPSSLYRPYDFDYEHPTETMRKHDLLGELLSRFRVLILDQRGTGWSAPLDMSDPRVDPVLVARYFDAAHQALDHQEVIRAVIPDYERFYVIAQSYAGLIGMRYLTMPGIARQPAGIVFASATLPHSDTVLAFESRRKSQLALNLELARAVPDVKALLGRLRAHFRENGLEPGSVHFLWEWLGKGPEGVWEPTLREKVEALLQADRAGLKRFIAKEASPLELLNYILSAKELTPGFTDRTLATLLVKRVPFEPWMLDEQWANVQMQGDASWVPPMLDALDRHPPPLHPPFPPVAEIRDRLASRHVLFTFGAGDAFMGDLALAHAKAYVLDERAQIQILPGGHRAIFQRSGVDALAAWIASPVPAR